MSHTHLCYDFCVTYQLTRALLQPSLLLSLSLLSCSTPCTTATTEGSCSVVEQCGCGPGESCTMALSTATCEWREACRVEAGELGVGDVCSLRNWDADLVEHCRPGTICWSEDPAAESGQCYE